MGDVVLFAGSSKNGLDLLIHVLLAFAVFYLVLASLVILLVVLLVVSLAAFPFLGREEESDEEKRRSRALC